MNRREFLLAAGSAVGALMLSHGVVGASDDERRPEFLERSYQGARAMESRVLVAYASKCGSTGGVAEAIGQTLHEMGASVDVRLAGNMKDLTPYRAIVLGSAIRMGRWLPEAVDFVKRHQDALSRVRCAYFVVCLTMKDDTPENRSKVLAYLDPVQKEAPKIQPTATGLFPGAVDFANLSFVLRSVLKAKGAREGDFRDWAAIKAWSAEVGRAFLAT
jgi:menaquinone-dependent protoporphyrinogen oxidase